MKKILIGLLIIGLAGLVLYAQKPDPFMGTWKLNLAKSKYNSGPPPKELTVKYEPAGEGVKTTIEGVDAEGKPIASHYTAQYDGKDYPVTGTAVPWDTIAFKRINASTFEITQKKDGKVFSTSKRVVSKNGKVMTITQTGTNAEGQQFKNTLVLDKQ